MAMVACPAVAAGQVPTQTLTVRNLAGVRPAYLARVEHAVTAQVNYELRRYWHTAPMVRFVSHGGWKVDLLPLDRQGGYVGGHWINPDDVPEADVFTRVSDLYGIWTPAFSHEVLEMLTDPTEGTALCGWIEEIGDPVESDFYYVSPKGRYLNIPTGVLTPRDAIAVSDFVTPAWYTGATGPWDFDRILHFAGDLARDGRAERVDGTTVNGGQPG